MAEEKLDREGLGQQYKFSRRDFLKLAGAGLAAAALPLPRGAKAEERPTPDEYTRLSEVGLADYWDVWRSGKKLEVKLGFAPTIFTEVFRTLDGVVEGRIDSHDSSISLLRDDWGELKEQAVGAARIHIQGLNIEIDDPSKVEDNYEDVRNFLNKAADSYPIHILGMPKRVRIKYSGGHASHDEIAFSTVLYREGAAGTWLHEATHTLDSLHENSGWGNVKEYMEKGKFIEYVKTYYSFLGEIADYFLAIPERHVVDLVPSDEGTKVIIHPTRATNFPSYYALFAFQNFDQKRIDDNFKDSFEKKLRDWQSTLGIEGEIKVTSSRKKDFMQTWRVFVHRVGKKLSGMDPARRKQLLENEHKIREIVQQTMTIAMFEVEPGYNIYFEGLLGGISHFLVGPSRGAGYLLDSGLLGGIPPWDWLRVKQLQLQNVRFQSFSRLANPESLSQVRQSFGLSPDNPSPEVVGIKSVTTVACAGAGVLSAQLKALSLLGTRYERKQLWKGFKNELEKRLELSRQKLLQEDGQVSIENLDGSRIELKDVPRDETFLLDSFSPTLVVLTGRDGKDSVILLPASSGPHADVLTPRGFEKQASEIGIGIAGPLFGFKDDKDLHPAHTTNYEVFGVRRGILGKERPYGMHWQDGLDVYVGNKRYHITLPWQGKESNVTKVRMGRILRY